MMDKQKIFFIIIGLSVMILIACLIGFIFFLKAESGQCLIDPIQFYANKVGQACYCDNGMQNTIGKFVLNP
jgi:hypothetical protein